MTQISAGFIPMYLKGSYSYVIESWNRINIKLRLEIKKATQTLDRFNRKYRLILINPHLKSDKAEEKLRGVKKSSAYLKIHILNYLKFTKWEYCQYDN